MRIIAAIIGGFVATLLLIVVGAVAFVPTMTTVNPNGWMTARDLGSADTDPFTKAFIARIGLLANSKEEALYLQSYEGEPFSLKALRAGYPAMPLQGGIEYEVHGKGEIPSAWWSITLYATDHYLFPNPVSRYSFGSDDVPRGADGDWSIRVSPKCSYDCDNWLPSPADGTFSLTLRIYAPAEEVYADLSTYPLPVIRRKGRP